LKAIVYGGLSLVTIFDIGKKCERLFARSSGCSRHANAYGSNTAAQAGLKLAFAAAGRR
jgi:hypothetical protein